MNITGRVLATAIACALILPAEAIELELLGMRDGLYEVRVGGGVVQLVTHERFAELHAEAKAYSNKIRIENTPDDAAYLITDSMVLMEKKVALKLESSDQYFSKSSDSVRIKSTTNGQRQYQEIWTEQLLEDGKYAYIGPDGNYLEVKYEALLDGNFYDTSFPLVAEKNVLKSSSVFTKESAGENSFRLKNLDGMYVQYMSPSIGHPYYYAPNGNASDATVLEIEEIGSVDTYILLNNSISTKRGNHQALVVSNLPAGVGIEGQATAPTQTTRIDGIPTFHQLVDYDAYINNELKVVVNKGFSGDINLVVSEYYGNVGATSEIATTLTTDQVDDVFMRLNSVDIGSFSKSIELTADTAFAAVTGSVRLNSANITSLERLVSLKAREGHYVKINSDADVIAPDRKLASSKKFTLKQHEFRVRVAPTTFSSPSFWGTIQKYSLKANNGQYISGCGKDLDKPHLRANRKTIASVDSCALFDMFEFMDGSVTFRAQDGNSFWNAADGGGASVKVNEDKILSRIKFTMKEEDGPNRTTTEVPLYFAVNPNIETRTTLTLSGIPEHAVLLNSDRSIVPENGDGTYSIDNPENTYYLDINAIDGSFDIEVQMSALGMPTFNKSLFIADVSFFSSSQKKVVARIPSDRNEVVVTRAGNAWKIKNINNEKYFTVDMHSVPLLVFDDGAVSYASDYSVAMEVPVDTSNTMLIIHNVPYGAVINNSIALGNNAYGILTDRLNVVGGKAIIYMDTSTVYIPNSLHQEGDVKHKRENYANGSHSMGIQVTASDHAFTESELTQLDGMTISGSANVEAYYEAENKANLSLKVNGDGLALEASVYQYYGAVVTAGATVSAENVAEVEVEASAEVSVRREVAIRVAADKHSTEVSAYAGQESVASLSASGSIDTPIVPGTRAETGGSVSVASYAYVKADGDIGYGGGKYGVAGEGDIAAGNMVTAEGYASGSVAGVGGGGGAGVSAGAGVGIGGGGHAMYDHGEISMGVSGDVALLLGIEADIDVTVDINAVADTGKLIHKGVLTASDAVDFGIIEVGEAINDYSLDVYDAVESGYISTEDAIEKFGASSSKLSNTGYKKVKRFSKKVGNSLKFWVP